MVCNALFVYLFLVLPGIMLFWSLTLLWPVLLTALVVLVIPIGVEFHDLHAWLWPADRSDRRTELAHMVLYPPAAMRAHDRLAHRICTPYDPLAVAAAICPPPIFAAFAAGELRRLHYPLAGETLQPHPRTAQIATVHRALKAQGLRPEDLLAPPPHIDTGSLSYCPRCGTEYVVPAGTCVDCPGVPLVRWPDTPRQIGTRSVLREHP